MSTNTVQGGKVWSPPQPARPSTPSKKKFDKINLAMQVMILAFMVVIGVIFPPPTDISDTMTPSNWANLMGESTRSGSLIVAGLIVYPLAAWVVAALTPIERPKKVLLFIAIVFIANAFVVDGYQKGVINVNEEELVSTWFAEEYNYQLIDFLDVDNEALTYEIAALVIDMETGEEKTVNYYENNDQVYFAVDNAELIEQVKKNALEKG